MLTYFVSSITTFLEIEVKLDLISLKVDSSKKNPFLSDNINRLTQWRKKMDTFSDVETMKYFCDRKKVHNI